MVDMLKAALTSLHGTVESAGFNVVHMVDDAFVNLPQLVWAGTSKEELAQLLGSGLIESPQYAPNGTFN